MRQIQPLYQIHDVKANASVTQQIIIDDNHLHPFFTFTVRIAQDLVYA